MSKKSEKVHYDVFSKHRGYICSCSTETQTQRTLQTLFNENEKFWQHKSSTGKKTRKFDCYAIARKGNQSTLIELAFQEEEEEFEDVTQ